MKWRKQFLLYFFNNCNFLSPNSYTHISLRDLYISSIGISILLQPNMWTDPRNIHIYRSQTHECGNWDWGGAIPRKGKPKWYFRCMKNQGSKIKNIMQLSLFLINLFGLIHDCEMAEAVFLYLFYNFSMLQTSIRQRRSSEEVQRWSNILKRWRPPVVHMGRPSRKNSVHEPITIFIRCLSTWTKEL